MSAPPEERTLVAVGCSTRRDYAFPLPLAGLLWRRVGYEMVALLVGDEREWASDTRTRATLGALREAGIAYRHVLRVGDYEDSTIAQNVRQHAACDPAIPSATWIMMSDADLLPIRRDFYHRHEGTAYRAVSYYSNGDGFRGKDDVLTRDRFLVDFQSLPTCHVAMRARDWREIYRLSPGRIEGSLLRTLDAWIEPRVRGARTEAEVGWQTWMSDQRCMTVRLCEQPWFPEGAFLVERAHPLRDRLDRDLPETWDLPFDEKRWIDAHLLRAPDEEPNWGRILKVVDALLPERAAFARGYHRAWSGR